MAVGHLVAEEGRGAYKERVESESRRCSNGTPSGVRKNKPQAEIRTWPRLAAATGVFPMPSKTSSG